MPPMPIEYKNRSGNTSSDASAPATVNELYSTVRPAVCSVRLNRHIGVGSTGELLAVAREHEQAVVDPQT